MLAVELCVALTSLCVQGYPTGLMSKHLVGLQIGDKLVRLVLKLLRSLARC